MRALHRFPHYFTDEFTLMHGASAAMTCVHASARCHGMCAPARVCALTRRGVDGARDATAEAAACERELSDRRALLEASLDDEAAQTAARIEAMKLEHRCGVARGGGGECHAGAGRSSSS